MVFHTMAVDMKSTAYCQDWDLAQLAVD